MTEDLAADLLPERADDANKGDAGKVLIIAGSRGMAGAAVLAARGAYRAGAGLVKVAAPWEVITTVQAAVPEATTLILEGTAKEYAKKVVKESRGFDSAVLGPGLGKSAEAVLLTDFILENIEIPLVLDADGINIVSENPEILKKARTEIIMTPHPGEMGRLRGKSAAEINENREEEAATYASETGVHLVLKGAGTVIASPDGEIYINTTGNPGMATAGSGDVLAGITGAFAALIPPGEAARLGAYVHGLAGDLCKKDLGVYGTMAGDIAMKTAEATKLIAESAKKQGKN